MTDTRADERLLALGRGEQLDLVLARGPMNRSDFDAWWQAELERRLPDLDATVGSDALHGSAQIVRDDRGIPHIFAGDDHDLFVAYGYAQAQDRLFQLDVQRRKGHGRLAALLGPEGVELDRIAHTIDFPAVLAAHLAGAGSRDPGPAGRIRDGRQPVGRRVRRRGHAARRVRAAGSDLGTMAGRGRAGRGAHLALAAHRPHPRLRRSRAAQAPPRGRGARGCDPSCLERRRHGHHAVGRALPGAARPAARGSSRPAGGGPLRGRAGLQQLGGGWLPIAVRQAAARIGPPHAVPALVVVPRGGSPRRLVRRRGRRAGGHAGPPVRAQPGARLGHHEQHLLAAGPVPGTARAGSGWGARL